MNWLRKLFGRRPRELSRLLPSDVMGLDWSKLKVDSNGLEYFDCGDVHLYPRTWTPLIDVFENGVLVEENIHPHHPKYGRMLYERYLLPGRHSPFAAKESP